MPTSSFGYAKKGVRHLVGRDFWEIQRTNNFEIQFTNTYRSGEVTDKDFEHIMLSVLNFTAPSIKAPPIKVPYGNTSINYAGKPEFSGGSFTIQDFIGADTEAILAKWFKQVYNYDTEAVGWASDYKKTGHLIEYSPDGAVYRQWTLWGCWPSSLDLGQFDQNGNSVRQIKCDMVYDICTPVPRGGGRQLNDELTDYTIDSKYTNGWSQSADLFPGVTIPGVNG